MRHRRARNFRVRRNPSPAEMSEVNFLFMSLIIKVCIFLQNPPDFFNLGWGEHLIMLSLEIF